jgi:hypothetical protein
MILEPSKSPEEIERRLSALNDPEFAEYLRAANPGLLGNEPNSYTSPAAPYWKRRIGFVVIAGLFAMSAGYGYVGVSNNSHPNARAKPHAAAIAPPRRHAKVAVRRNTVKHQTAVAVHPRSVVVPAHRISTPAVTAPSPNEALIRQARAQLLHERALAAQARADAARAQHQAKLAMQAQAQAQARANAVALSQALAEARAQARAQALARAQAQAEQEAQAQREQDWVVQNASGSGTKPGVGPPPDSHRISTYPDANVPLPGPGPIDPNCTPHRGSLFGAALTSAVLSHVRVGGTNAGAILRMVHP